GKWPVIMRTASNGTVWLEPVNAEANQGEGRKLIATEQRRTQTRRQIGPIPPRTHQAVQPALGGPSVRKARIGAPLLHRLRRTFTLIISAPNDTTEPQSNH